MGKITITVREADALRTTQHWNAQAKNAVDESDIKNQLQQHTLRGKVWKMLDHLDSLAGIIGAIDQAAKVCVTCILTNSILMWGPYAAQFVSRFSLEDMLITIQGVSLLHGPSAMLCFTSL